MSYSGGIVTAPVRMIDVRQAVGLSGNEIGTLITNGGINKWAKYKPVKKASVNTQEGQFDFNNNTWLSTANWWQANDGLCGFAMETATEFGNSLTTSGTFMYKLTHGQLGWTYDRPVGGTNSPFRMEDFAGYNRYAIQPYGEIGSTEIYINMYGEAQIDWEIVEVGDDNIKLTDITVDNHPLSDFYLGLCLWSGSQFYLFTSSAKFGAGGTLSITIDNASTLEGTWNCMPFFTLYQVNSGGTFDANGLFVPMADVTPLTLTFSSEGTNYFEMPEGMWNSSDTAVTYEITAVNESSNSHYYSSIVVAIYGNSPTGTLLASKTISGVTVSANTSRTLTGTISVSKSSYTSYYIVVTDGTSGTAIDSKYNQIEEYIGM